MLAAEPVATTTAYAAPAEQPLDLKAREREYNDWASAKRDENDERRTARHYYHGAQYSAAQLAHFKAIKQPPIVLNRMARKINGIVGIIEDLRQDPKAYPRTPKPEHAQQADLVSAVLRYALDQCRWEQIEPEAIRACAIGGLVVAGKVLTAGDQGDTDVEIELIDDDSFFYDPRSFKPDLSDALFLGVSKWLDLGTAQEGFPDHADALANAIGDGGIDSDADEERRKRWFNIEKKQVRVVEHWYKRGGTWRWCLYARNLLLEHGDSPYKDQKGRSIHRFLPFSACVDHDGDRYGFPRNLKGPQDEVNVRRAVALRKLQSRRIIAEKGAVDDIEVARREAVRPDGYIEKNPGLEFEFDDAKSQADLRGEIEFLNEAKAEIDNYGPNPALIGDGPANRSGRALNIIQKAGLAELGPFLTAYREWKLRIYRELWCAVQQFWTAERWIRVTDDNQVAQFIQINGWGFDANGFPTLINALGALDVDILIDETPDTINLMAEVLELLTSMAAKGMPVPPEIAIELSTLPASLKKRLLELLQQAKQPDPAAEQGKAIMLQGEAAKAEKTAAEVEKVRAETAQIAQEIALEPAKMQMEAQQSARSDAIKADAARQRFQQPQRAA